jgi:hypothetical protein
MLNKHHHIPHHQMFFTVGGKIPLRAAEGMWKLIKKQPISEGEVADMFFDTRFGSARPGAAIPGNRYYSNDVYGNSNRAEPSGSVDDDSDGGQPSRRPSAYSQIDATLRQRRTRSVVFDDDDRVASANLGDFVTVDNETSRADLNDESTRFRFVDGDGFRRLPEYDPDLRPSVGNKRPRNQFVSDSAGCDEGEEEEEEEEEENENNSFVVSDGHLSDEEGSDGGQPFLR